MPIKVAEITDTMISPGQTPKETYRKVFENIGEHFKENAERMAEIIDKKHAGMTIEINLPINDIVTVTLKNIEYVINKKEI